MELAISALLEVVESGAKNIEIGVVRRGSGLVMLDQEKVDALSKKISEEKEREKETNKSGSNTDEKKSITESKHAGCSDCCSIEPLIRMLLSALRLYNQESAERCSCCRTVIIMYERRMAMQSNQQQSMSDSRRRYSHGQK